MEIVKLKLPGLPLGIPLKVPVKASRDTPAGRFPDVFVQDEYAGTPPVAVRVREYATPVEPAGNVDPDVIINGGAVVFRLLRLGSKRIEDFFDGNSPFMIHATVWPVVLLYQSTSDLPSPLRSVVAMIFFTS